MLTRHALPALIALSLAAPIAAQPAQPLQPAQPSPPQCGPMAAPVYEPGCDGPGRLTCDTGASLPAGSTWCLCDGRTAESASMAPPSGVRYRFRGACSTTARFELTDERTATNARTGKVVIFLAVGGGSTEATRLQGPCRPTPAAAGEMARLTCGRGAAPTVLTMRQDGDAIVVRGAAPPHTQYTRIEFPAGQRVTAEAPRRF